MSVFPHTGFTGCLEKWGYTPHTIENATAHAEKAPRRFKEFPKAIKILLFCASRIHCISYWRQAVGKSWMGRLNSSHREKGTTLGRMNFKALP